MPIAAPDDGSVRTSEADSEEARQSRRSERRWLLAAVFTMLVVTIVVQGNLGPSVPAASPTADPTASDEDEPSLGGAAVPVPTSDLPHGVRCQARGVTVSSVEDCAAWVVRTEIGPYSQLASIGEQVIAVTENDVVALEVAGGRELWSR